MVSTQVSSLVGIITLRLSLQAFPSLNLRSRFAASCICSSPWWSKGEQNSAEVVETAMQSTKVVNLYILIVSSDVLPHPTSKTNTISCHYLAKLSTTVTVHISLSHFIGSWIQESWKTILLGRSNEKVYKKREIKSSFSRQNITVLQLW